MTDETKERVELIWEAMELGLDVEHERCDFGYLREAVDAIKGLPEEQRRGAVTLANEGHGLRFDCYACEREGKPRQRTAVKLGPIAEPHRDPTQTYVLDCGHVAI